MASQIGAGKAILSTTAERLGTLRNQVGQGTANQINTLVTQMNAAAGTDIGHNEIKQAQAAMQAARSKAYEAATALETARAALQRYIAAIG